MFRYHQLQKHHYHWQYLFFLNPHVTKSSKSRHSYDIYHFGGFQYFFPAKSTLLFPWFYGDFFLGISIFHIHIFHSQKYSSSSPWCPCPGARDELEWGAGRCLLKFPYPLAIATDIRGSWGTWLGEGRFPWSGSPKRLLEVTFKYGRKSNLISWWTSIFDSGRGIGKSSPDRIVHFLSVFFVLCISPVPPIGFQSQCILKLALLEYWTVIGCISLV